MDKIIVPFFFLILSLQMHAQQFENVALSTTDDKIIVSYDLLGNKNKTYDVKLRFRLDGDKLIHPNKRNLKGDIGKIKPGKGKAIIWDLYKDVDELSGSVEPELDAVLIDEDNQETADAPTPLAPPPNSNQQWQSPKPEDKRFRVGIKVSTGRAGVLDLKDPLTETEIERKWSPQIGAYFRWNFQRRLYLQPEVLYHYDQHNTRIINDAGTDSFFNDRNHELRSQLVLGVAPIGLGLYFNTGFYHSFLIGGQRNQLENEEVIETAIYESISADEMTQGMSRNDYGWLIGGSLNFNKGGFVLGYLYAAGLRDMYYNYAYPIPVPVTIEQDFTNNSKSRAHHFYIQKKF